MFLTPEHFQELETLQEGDCLYCMLNFTSRFGTPESEQTRQSVDRLYRHMDIAGVTDPIISPSETDFLSPIFWN